MTDQPFDIVGADRDSPWLITCDHASNRVPPSVNGGTLGLADAEMNRHIAYDIGAAGVARHLADIIGAPAILSRFSRLVVDPNRGEDDPTIIMKLYDGTIVPANRALSPEDRRHRIETFYRPYDRALADLAARRPDTIIVAVHSFTPRLAGRSPRPWHIGILTASDDRRLADPLLEALRREPDLCVGENEPYAGHLPGDAIDRHALAHGRPNALIELRHDLITDPVGQHAWAERLAPMLEEARSRADL